ncbi:MAG TPA: DUF885 domain-containing protein, partial [Opitutaceae bacterium]|nr:DUF885 domain-containing protein [Opitutaceae bacterium]
MRFRCMLVALAGWWMVTPIGAADAGARYDAIIAAKGTVPESARAQELFKAAWEILLEENPEFATVVGRPAFDRVWRDLSPEAIARRRATPHHALRALRTFDPAQLGDVDRVSLELLRQQVQDVIAGERYPSELLALNQLEGVQQGPAQTMAFMRNGTVAELENQVARLKAMPRFIDQTIAVLANGLARGVTPPKIALRDVPQQVLNQIVEDPLKAPLLRGLTNVPASVPEEERQRINQAATQIYLTEIVPAWRRLHDFLAQRYLPGARETTAATALPDGEAWYAHRVRTQTTTDLVPDKIHAIGLAEVARIRGEMERVKATTGFKGTLPEFFQYLRTDPKFFFTDKDDLLRAYRDIAKRVDPELVKVFRTLPRMPYGVIPVPGYAEKSQTTAYYWPGSHEAGRPGFFFANTYALHTRPKWEMEALTLHEAVPGHHLQLSLAQEIEGLPEFRREAWGYTGFVEGWGLYAESLGEDMG